MCDNKSVNNATAIDLSKLSLVVYLLDMAGELRDRSVMTTWFVDEDSAINLGDTGPETARALALSAAQRGEDGSVEMIESGREYNGGWLTEYTDDNGDTSRYVYMVEVAA